ncbi:carbohydrate-binding protein, partial [Halomicronema sp. CCY15110]|uniref:carbohydrate-binding protein n=1 Tax=Halomicronema sp. CCY15110 TaxID=2767773 RepID=UPI0019501170
MSFTYEAELATLSGPEVATNHEGYLGSGFADYLNPTGDYAEFAIEVDANGQYELSFRYALGADANRLLSLTVDGEDITTLDFSSTGNWTNWNDLLEQVQLTAGNHTVRLTAIGTSGPNLDSLTVDALRIEPIVVPPDDTVPEADGEPIVLPSRDVVTGASNAFFNFEHWVSYTAIKTGVVYQSSLVDFNIQVGGLRVAPLFDEAAYLQANPDVAAAVQQGSMRYGFEHFVLFGMDEGRAPG